MSLYEEQLEAVRNYFQSEQLTDDKATKGLPV